MHLYCHLVECEHDYGPIFGFWLFSFERYNEMLGKFPNNQKHIEIQLMQRFETEMQLYSLSHNHFTITFISGSLVMCLNMLTLSPKLT